MNVYTFDDREHKLVQRCWSTSSGDNVDTLTKLRQLQLYNIDELEHPGIEYEHTTISLENSLHNGKRYRILKTPRHSAISVTFPLHNWSGLVEVNVSLLHNGQGLKPEIDLLINNNRANKNIKVKKNHFESEEFSFGKKLFKRGENTFTVMLGKHSKAAYMLSQISVAVTEKC